MTGSPPTPLPPTPDAVHLLRYLDDVAETSAFTLWANQMAGVLCAARDSSTAAADAGLASVRADIAARITAEFHATLDVSFALLPDGMPHRARRSHAQRKAFNLASRLRTGEDQALRLLVDTRVPSTNNGAEPSKARKGAAHFANVRSYLQTGDAHGQNLLDAWRALFTTGAWIPPPAGPVTLTNTAGQPGA